MAATAPPTRARPITPSKGNDTKRLLEGTFGNLGVDAVEQRLGLEIARLVAQKDLCKFFCIGIILQTVIAHRQVVEALARAVREHFHYVLLG